MRIVQTHQTVVNHDAIGNDIEIMQRILSKKHDCKVYAQNALHKMVDYIDEREFYNLIEDPDVLIIYHHSSYWREGETILRKAKGKIIIRYHNITPPEYFVSFSNDYYTQCKLGREQTARFIVDFPKAIWLVDSCYNALDVTGVSKECIAVLPPFHKIEEWAEKLPDEKLLSELLNSTVINLLFVGRIAPNKGHLFLLNILNEYKANYGNSIKLRIIGKFDNGLVKYNDLINKRITEYGLCDNVEFVGEINDALLSSYYLGSDFFICVSEHEGFCVPIPEAQFFGLPIIAKTTSAIPETLGMNQIALKDDPLEYAAAISMVYNNREYYGFLRENGRMNFESRFSANENIGQFTRILKQRMEVTI